MKPYLAEYVRRVLPRAREFPKTFEKRPHEVVERFLAVDRLTADKILSKMEEYGILEATTGPNGKIIYKVL